MHLKAKCSDCSQLKFILKYQFSQSVLELTPSLWMLLLLCAKVQGGSNLRRCPILSTQGHNQYLHGGEKSECSLVIILK